MCVYRSVLTFLQVIVPWSEIALLSVRTIFLLRFMYLLQFPPTTYNSLLISSKCLILIRLSHFCQSNRQDYLKALICIYFILMRQSNFACIH